ncbi:hypothetical protein RB2044 [Rhodopirellula baltica SH 1]|uniref:Uncharacterized protein n=1 Tax=Rhodopirellula baltica (strain DSM 10527 / NCIMB 13988 / SH1) TaxID=243090 RepID=Q7UWH0_RHOBA|nr:hypothetical protein RB2044 [Rhodopirellula baltica SH 1]
MFTTGMGEHAETLVESANSWKGRFRETATRPKNHFVVSRANAAFFPGSVPGARRGSGSTPLATLLLLL